MEITIQKIFLENYRCFPQKQVDFHQRTRISGRNKQGKSTIMSAFLEVMTGKEANGTQPDGIRPHDENGVDIDKVDIIRELHLEIDGKPVVIRKITKQKWRKPHGQSEEVFDGNATEYEVDGFPMSSTKFAEFIGRIAPADVLLICSNAQPFLSTMQKSTADARKLLEPISGFSIDNFIAENGYEAVAEITKGHSVEDTLKKLRKELTAQKKKVDEKNTEVKYEKNRKTETIDISALELAKSKWREKLAVVDAEEQQLEQAVKAYNDLFSETSELISARHRISELAEEKWRRSRAEVSQKIFPLRSKKSDLEFSLKDAECKLHSADRIIETFTVKMNQARADYEAYVQPEYDESRLHAIEAEEMSEDSFICPTCGQHFLSEKVDEIIAEFKEKKKRRIEEELRKRDAFYKEDDERYEMIVERGNLAKEGLTAATKEKESCENRISEIQSEIQSVTSEIEKLTAELEKFPEEVDLSANEEYQTLSKQIADKQAQLLSLESGAEKRSEFRQRRNEYNAELNKNEAQILKAKADAEEKEKRLAKLEKEQRELGQIEADLQRQIDTVMEFSRRKNEALAAAINPYFDHFHFEFLEYTQEGNPVETLKIVCGGTDYFDGLNTGDKKLSEIDLCRGLQKLNNVFLPIFCDESGEIDSWRIPEDLEQQLILIERKDGELKVEEMA